MKISRPVLAIIIIGIMGSICLYFIINNNFFRQEIDVEEKTSSKEETTLNEVEENTAEKQEDIVEVVEVPAIVYDGLTLDELAAKLDKSLTSTLSGTGMAFAKRSIELGLDPYLAVAIVLHETGCKWKCSTLVNECNNVGGMKGSPGCGGGPYKAFNTLDEGINSYLDNLYYNYYAKGLTTAETMNSKYAASTTWASKVNYYIDYIKQK